MSTAGQCRSAADTLVSICVRADCYVRCDGDETQKSKKPALKAGFSNLAPLTGIAFAINWLIGKLNLKVGVVKTTRMTTKISYYITIYKVNGLGANMIMQNFFCRFSYGTSIFGP